MPEEDEPVVYHWRGGVFVPHTEMMNVRILPYTKMAAAVLPYDPRTCEVAAQLVDVIHRADRRIEVEHVGSTSVPGCSGKGVIDLAVLYPEGCLSCARDVLDALGF
jgi:GrpB-like predicted nucleotidyltransferase (UPF0157 family)